MRAIAVRCLFAFSCVCLGSGGIAHALAYSHAAQIVNASDLPAFFANAFKGLWLSDSTSVLTLALAFGVLAVKPHSGNRVLIAIIAAAPVASAISIYITMGPFFAGHLMLAAALSALAAMLLRDPAGAASVRTRRASMHRANVSPASPVIQ